MLSSFYKAAAGAAAMILLLSSCSNGPLQRGCWEKDNYKKLNSLIRSEGIRSRTYSEDNRPYAVFDFDNTSIVNDVENSLVAYQIQNLRYRMNPDELNAALTDCLPDLNVKILGELTTAMLVEDILADYAYLYEAYVGKFNNPKSPEAVAAMAEVKKTDEYRDFCAKFSALYDAIGEGYDYGTFCLWILKLFNGFTYDELTALTKESCAYFSAMDEITDVTWESPERGVCGKVSWTHAEGLKVTDEMKDLYQTLRENGFDVYICSASMETIVEAMACDPAYGFNMDPEYVFGLRLADGGSGVINAEYDPTYAQTFKEGKTAAIRAIMAPLHNGEGPDLVGGDSNGDYNMLTDFPDLKVGLIINCGNGGNIGKLMTSGDPKYVVQGRDFRAGRFVPTDGFQE